MACRKGGGGDTACRALGEIERVSACMKALFQASTVPAICAAYFLSKFI